MTLRVALGATSNTDEAPTLPFRGGRLSHMMRQLGTDHQHPQAREGLAFQTLDLCWRYALRFPTGGDLHEDDVAGRVSPGGASWFVISGGHISRVSYSTREIGMNHKSLT